MKKTTLSLCLAALFALSVDALAPSPEARADIPVERLKKPRPGPKRNLPNFKTDGADAKTDEADVKAPGPDAQAPAADAATPPPDVAAPSAPDVKPEGAVRLEHTRPERLPDGVFVGKVEGAGLETEVQLTIVNGLIVEAFLRRNAEGLPVFDLASIGPPGALGLRLRGRSGTEHVKLSGELFDAERGTGPFEGVLARKQVEGTWTVTRR